MQKKEKLDLQYFILPGKPLNNSECLVFYRKCYSHWKTFWTDFFTKSNTLASFQKDDFLRQDFIGVLANSSGEIINILMHSVYDIRLESCLDAKYFNYYTPDFFASLRQSEVITTMSFEYLTSNPMRPRNLSRRPYAEMTCFLGTEILKQLGIHSGVAAARKDVGVVDITRKMGWREIVPDLQLHGCPVSLTAGLLPELNTHPDARIADTISQLWEERIDFTGLMDQSKTAQVIPWGKSEKRLKHSA
jgi:hypothetical protein